MKKANVSWKSLSARSSGHSATSEVVSSHLQHSVRYDQFKI